MMIAHPATEHGRFLSVWVSDLMCMLPNTGMSSAHATLFPQSTHTGLHFDVRVMFHASVPLKWCGHACKAWLTGSTRRTVMHGTTA